MGLFDKRDKKTRKAGDDFDSPVEKIDLSAPEPAREVTAEPPPDSERSIAQKAPVQAKAKAKPAPEADDGEYDSSFGIQKAIELMRTLPADNVELVVQVVKLTLESTKIRISTIIEDATRKQDDIKGRIKVLKDEIAEFEKEIATRKDEITSQEADLDETSTVKERLQLAEKLSTKSGGGKAAAPKGKSGSTGGLGSSSARPASGTSPALGKAGKHTVVAKK